VIALVSKSSFLSDEEKNEMVKKYRNLVYYFSYRYRFFDQDPEEVEGWAFLGLAKAIKYYEDNPSIEFEAIVFSKIKKEIFSQYSKNRNSKSKAITSLQKVIMNGQENGETTLEHFLVDEDQPYIDAENIKQIIEEALFEESDIYRKINLDFLLTNKDAKDIASENGISYLKFKKIQRRGQSLIKNYLINNDIILDYLGHPDEKQIKERKIINHRMITPEDFGKIKYIRKSFPFLNENDISIILNTSSYMIAQLLDYPTSTYIKTSLDDSISKEALRYCQRKYPERIPGPIVVHSI
jgi:uncharacterized protein Smg (DUF494 family)